MLKPAQFVSLDVRGLDIPPTPTPTDLTGAPLHNWLVGYVREKQKEFDDERPSRGYATTACLLIAQEGAPAILAFNDIPQVCSADYASTPRGVERAPKYAALGHAEVGAIGFAARQGIQTAGSTMVLAWFPCINCADAIVKAGVKRLIATQPDDSYKPATYDFPAAVAHLSANGVEVVIVK